MVKLKKSELKSAVMPNHFQILNIFTTVQGCDCYSKAELREFLPEDIIPNGPIIWLNAIIIVIVHMY